MEDHNNTVIAVLCGLPGSGKTQFVRDFNRHKPDFQTIHIHYDEIIPKNSNLEEKDMKTRRKGIVRGIERYLKGSEAPSWMNGVSEGGARHRIIFIDDNNHLSSMRYEYYQVARSCEIGFCQFHVSVPLEEAQSRNRDHRSSKDAIPPDVIAKMHEKFEAPQPYKNPWEALSFIIHSSEEKDIWDMIESVIRSALVHPLKDTIAEKQAQADDSRSACSASVIHQADNLLRKKLHAAIEVIKAQDNSPETEIRYLVERKKEVLEDLKTGHTRIPSEIIRLIGDKGEKNRILGDLSHVLDMLLKEKKKNQEKSSP
eukprot:TRINITY_DN8181_c0_g1_i1.p1 TRINITY_DN8181_c0_g1~~TRINITY_DN8181_c0_g1_i1.p1  ORF type:complete len:313 (-),score=64.89 TRINITY_DN8181_c0_g1_i1:135-1073(-)